LGNNLENLTLTGTTAINATGNALNNTLIGNSAVNTLTGGAGDDYLDGGAGNDKLLGGLGNDVYVVDSTTDTITENTNEGIDTVRSSVTYTLGNNLENLTLTGTTAINATGNALNNTLIGNNEVNILNGGAGNDILDGQGGNDQFTGGTGSDTLIYQLL
ncbi:Ig family protein, partial [Escherichia coli]